MSRWPDDEPQQSVEDDESQGGVEEDEEEFPEGEWELDPNDPSHPDHDLSTSAGYGFWEPAPKPLLLRRGVVVAVTIFVIIGLMIPLLIRIY